jgi:hypothetical protein
MRLLHISDLHAAPKYERDQRKIVSAMLADASERHKESKFDGVIFTGDLGFAGKTEDFALAHELLLKPLMEQLDLTPAELVLLPGNHDVDRDKVDDIFEAGMSQRLCDRETVNGLLSVPSRLSNATARLETWNEFHADFYKGIANVKQAGPLAFVLKLEGNDGCITVAALNSAWRCSNDTDRGRLLVGEAQLTPALADVSSADLPVIAIHHPLDWLAPFDADCTRTALEAAGYLMLSGHEHRADPMSNATARGGFVHDRAGCLFEKHDYSNTYSIIDVPPRDTKVTISVRDWYKDRGVAGEFDEATRLAHDGRVELVVLAFGLPRARKNHAVTPFSGQSFSAADHGYFPIRAGSRSSCRASGLHSSHGGARHDRSGSEHRVRHRCDHRSTRRRLRPGCEPATLYRAVQRGKGCAADRQDC